MNPKPETQKPTPKRRFFARCQRCGSRFEAHRIGLTTCIWGGCNGSAIAVPDF